MLSYVISSEGTNQSPEPWRNVIITNLRTLVKQNGNIAIADFFGTEGDDEKEDENKGARRMPARTLGKVKQRLRR